MKKSYTTPQAIEEAFAANNYIAACQMSTSSTSTANRMQCINPSHEHSLIYGNHNYFAGVWVSATTTGCSIIINPDNDPKTAVRNKNASTPAFGATVYAADGSRLICNSTYKVGQVTYYVPSNLTQCYGSYIYNGTYSEITQKLNS